MGRIPPSQSCQKEPRSSNPFSRVKTGIVVSATVPTDPFLPLRFAAVNLRLNMGNDRMARAQSSRLTAVCGSSDVLAGVTMHSAAVLCLTPWTPVEATKNLPPLSSEQQKLLQCKRSLYAIPNRRQSYTRPHGVTYKKTVSRLAVATFFYCPLSRIVQQ